MLDFLRELIGIEQILFPAYIYMMLNLNKNEPALSHWKPRTEPEVNSLRHKSSSVAQAPVVVTQSSVFWLWQQPEYCTRDWR